MQVWGGDAVLGSQSWNISGFGRVGMRSAIDLLGGWVSFNMKVDNVNTAWGVEGLYAQVARTFLIIVEQEPDSHGVGLNQEYCSAKFEGEGHWQWSSGQMEFRETPHCPELRLMET